MGCRDVHAATVLAFLSGTASVAGLLAAVLLPNWRQMRLYTFNKNERNVTVYTGLWIKCARFDGSRDCVIYDPQWYTAVDQLDLRVLQFALPLSNTPWMRHKLFCTFFVPLLHQHLSSCTHRGLIERSRMYLNSLQTLSDLQASACDFFGGL
ncbi:claudin-12 isoform X3 [Egretta garzetta]|uniref:claudin-12 isoform X3 n=1 Tax=Egretta garzetta TaxID=188379 RepID=UPI00163D2E88|nr:claudin-12 isoform X3 [Egretta garzetta]